LYLVCQVNPKQLYRHSG